MEYHPRLYDAPRMWSNHVYSIENILCFGSSLSGVVTYTRAWLPIYLLPPLEVMQVTNTLYKVSSRTVWSLKETCMALSAVYSPDSPSAPCL